MAREPQRSPEPRPLGAAIVPVERALLARAKALEEQATELNAAAEARDADQQTAEDVRELVGRRRLLAKEFRALAEELAHW